MSTRHGALVLAAGFASRFGGGKLDAPLADGRRLAEHTLDNIAAALDEILIVSRPGAAGEWNRGDWPALLFDGAEQGMGASLAWGISRLPAWDGCLVCLADMPFIQPLTYRLLAAELNPETIVIPSYNSRRGNPVGFGSRFFAELTELGDDRGGREIVCRHEAAAREIPVGDPAILEDIDTPADLDRCQARAKSREQTAT